MYSSSTIKAGPFYPQSYIHPPAKIYKQYFRIFCNRIRYFFCRLFTPQPMVPMAGDSASLACAQPSRSRSTTATCLPSPLTRRLLQVGPKPPLYPTLTLALFNLCSLLRPLPSLPLRKHPQFAPEPRGVPRDVALLQKGFLRKGRGWGVG